MTFVSGGRPRFLYFDAQLDRPPWPSLRVLDFGGNAGNLFYDERCSIRHENYWSLDVSRDAVALGQRRYPNAHFVFYDRFHPFFNPDGKGGQPISLTGPFDVIFAYSVLTHLSHEDADDLWKALRAMLRPNGIFAFSFLDPGYRPAPRLQNNLEYRLRGGDAHRAADFEAVAVVDGRLGDAGRYPPRATQYDVLHSCEFIRRTFPDALIKRPVFGERQHCAILRQIQTASI